MIPYQIYCDYLEDKGIDTRLLRLEERDFITVSNPYEENLCNGNGYGAGFPQGYGSSDDGSGAYPCDGYGAGIMFNYGRWDSGNGTGFGYCSLGDGSGAYSKSNYGLSNGNGRGYDYIDIYYEENPTSDLL